MEDRIELVVQYSEQREKIYKEFLERLEEWISIRPRTIQGLLDVISYMDGFQKSANLTNIIGSAVGFTGAGAVFLAPFTGVVRENCEKAQELIDKDAKATDALTSSLEEYHELTQRLSDCLGSAHGKINFESLPSIGDCSLAASRYLLGSAELAASALAVGKGASKAAARLLPVIGAVCMAVDVWSIVTTTVDIAKGSKSETGKELLKVVQKLRKQGRKVIIHCIEAIRLKSQDAPCKYNEKQLIQQLFQLNEKERETESDSSDSDESDDENSINFCLMNARSVFNKWEVIANYVVQKSTDVLAATETWDRLKPLVTKVLKYYPFFYLPREARRGGGVGALIKSDIKVIDIKCNFKFQTFECINCILLVDSKGRTSSMIDIYILYRPPNLVLGHFPEEFKSLIKGSLSNSKVIIMGDFNVDWKRSETNKYELSKTNKMRDLLCELQLRQHVEEETHKKGRILDWVVTGNLEPYRLSNLRVDRLRDLDHYPVTFTLELKR